MTGLGWELLPVGWHIRVRPPAWIIGLGLGLVLWAVSDKRDSVWALMLGLAVLVGSLEGILAPREAMSRRAGCLSWWYLMGYGAVAGILLGRALESERSPLYVPALQLPRESWCLLGVIGGALVWHATVEARRRTGKPVGHRPMVLSAALMVPLFLWVGYATQSAHFRPAVLPGSMLVFGQFLCFLWWALEATVAFLRANPERQAIEALQHRQSPRL